VADPARQLGYKYVVALVDAIETVIDGAGRRDFAYRGADLSRAVQCALFINLVNDGDLYEAFRAHSRGEQAPQPLPAYELGARVARLLLDRAAPRSRAARQRLRWRLRNVRNLPRYLSERHPGVEESRGSRACFFLDHSKFLRFIAPVADRLGAENVIVVPLVAEAEAALSGSGYTSASLEERETPVGRAIGAAVREWPASLLTLYDAVLELLAELRPGCSIVLEGNSPLDEVTNQGSRVLGIPCLCLQQGWSPIVHNGFRGMSFTRMGIWGEGFREILAPYNHDQRFEVVGNPVLAGVSETPSERAVAFFLQPLSPLIGEEHQRQMHELILEAARSFPRDTILVREHPGWPLADAAQRRLEAVPNLRMVPASSYPLSEVIGASRAAVSIYSTSLLEAAALGTPPLVFNPTSMPRYAPDLEEIGAGVEVDRIEPAIRVLDRLLHDDAYARSFEPAMTSFRARYFAQPNGGSPGRIAALIDQLATGSLASQ
jgi:hypothetical protein